MTGLPESLGQLTDAGNAKCQGLSKADEIAAVFGILYPAPLTLSFSHALIFPPANIARQGMPATKAFLLLHHHPLKMLLLILAARRRRMRHPPPELWELIRDEFLDSN
jgi:hypothetical protein